VEYKHQYYYHLTAPTKQVAYPLLSLTWKQKVLEKADGILEIPRTRARSSTDDTGNNHESLEAEASPQKRQREEILLVNEETNLVGEDVPPPPLPSYSYWPDSPEAHWLFLPKRRNNCDNMTCVETPRETVERRIELLSKVQEREDCWKTIVQGHDPDNICTKVEIFEIRQRAAFLCCAYRLALHNMNKWTWHQCCTEACNTMNALGFKQASCSKTIANWNIVFRKLECFPHPNLFVQCGKRPLPRLLEMFPDAKGQIIAYAVKNLATLSIESLHDYIISTVLPRLVKTWREEEQIEEQDSTGTSTGTTGTIAPTELQNHNHDSITAKFLKAHGLKSLSLSTTWRWMRLLGFSYDTRRKGFYVDGHEREDVVANRVEFCNKYLTEYEPYCKRWIQIRLEKAQTIKDLDLTFGYHYLDIVSNEQRVEFHIDYFNQVQEKNLPQQIQEHQDPTMSIRVARGARPLMLIGQDESVFAQYLMPSKNWMGPNGEVPLLPKSEGDGYMLSAFISRDFGFGRQLSNDELLRINREKRIGQQYKDSQAATEILKTSDKPLLTESPFVKYLYIGANNEGYWNSFHMSIQFEDVVDCLQVLYPEFDFVFLFDHSQGHARRRNGALNALNMSRNFGGAQARMRNTTIMSTAGFLGPHSPFLKVGDTQSLVFNSNDDAVAATTDAYGPWYLTPQQRQSKQHDRSTGLRKNVERSKKMLRDALADAGVTFQANRSYSKKELQDFATTRGISLFENKEQIVPGWEGQPKGLLQVLGERGLIQRDQLEKYTLDGKKDPITQEVDLQFSLRHILQSCTDFREEETALEYLGSELGVKVQLTPKFHAELAGEGVEYCWAHAKAFYRRQPLSRKRGRDTFKQLVRDCTCPVNVLPRVRVVKFSGRSRAYICTYHYIEQRRRQIAAQEAGDLNPVDVPPPVAPNQALLLRDITRIMKDFKCHRSAFDFDRGFVNAELRTAERQQEATRDDER